MSAQKIPSYRLHAASGLGVVTIHGKDVYLGTHNTPESLAAYGRAIAELLATGTAPVAPNSVMTIREVVDRYRLARLVELSPRDRAHIEPILSTMAELYGDTPAADFGPVRFEALRMAFVRKDWSRNYTNDQMGRVKQVLRWLVTRELFPGEKLAAIREVLPLRAGQTQARELKKITAVPIEHVEVTLKNVPDPVRGLILFQLHTGCRPGEATTAHRCELDTTGRAKLPSGSTLALDGVWVYSPSAHKNAWRGSRRFILIGPQGQAALQEFVDRADASGGPGSAAGFLFRPSEVAKAPRPGLYYATESYARAVAKGAKKAGVPHWHPYQLRHLFAGKIRDLLTSEHAKEVLGHKHLSMTDHYTDVGLLKAAEAVRKAG